MIVRITIDVIDTNRYGFRQKARGLMRYPEGT